VGGRATSKTHCDFKSNHERDFKPKSEYCGLISYNTQDCALVGQLKNLFIYIGQITGAMAFLKMKIKLYSFRLVYT
jgi:hypothetical protein